MWSVIFKFFWSIGSLVYENLSTQMWCDDKQLWFGSCKLTKNSPSLNVIVRLNLVYFVNVVKVGTINVWTMKTISFTIFTTYHHHCLRHHPFIISYYAMIIKNGLTSLLKPMYDRYNFCNNSNIIDLINNFKDWFSSIIYKYVITSITSDA